MGSFREEKVCRYTAPNGQVLYFTTETETPFVRLEDVNFDGVEDIVIVTAVGATNAFYEFFVWDGSQYVWAEHWQMEYGLCNYQLDPRGYVVCYGHNGLAGALFEEIIFCWEGTALRPLRRMVSEEKTEYAFNDDTYTLVTYNNVLSIRMSDDRTNEEWYAEATLEQFTAGYYDTLQEVLWQGL